MNTSKVEFKRRLEVCESCFSYRAVTKQCKECSCFLIVKAFLKSSKCPLGKWENEAENSIPQD